MITMVTAGGIFFFLGLRARIVSADRWLALVAALGLGVIVTPHAVSRNSQLLLLALVMSAVFFRFRSPRAALGDLVTTVALAPAMWQFSPQIQSRFQELITNPEEAKLESNYATSGGLRWRMYQEAVQGMAAHPVFGMGLGNCLPHWRSVWLDNEKDVPPEGKHHFSEINNPHNDFLLAGMETGVAGMVTLLWLLTRFVRAGWRQRRAAGGITVVLGVFVWVTALVNALFRDAALGMTLLLLLSKSMAGHGRQVNE